MTRMVRSPYFLPILASLLHLSLSASLHGQVWNAEEDFSEDTNPNGAWSYHATNGDLFLQQTGGACGGAPSGWSIDGAGACPTLFSSETRLWSSAQLGRVGDEELRDFGGHGEFVIRWTSPVTGEVRVQGTILQAFGTQSNFTADNRVMTAEIRHNDEVVAEAFPPLYATARPKVVHEFFGAPESPGTRTPIADFSFTAQVSEGDTLSYHAVGSIRGSGGTLTPTFMFGTFCISTTDVDPCPLPELCNNGEDDDGDGLVDCADAECKCNTPPETTPPDDPDPRISFPVFTNREFILDPEGITVPGHTGGNRFVFGDCPIFFPNGPPEDFPTAFPPSADPACSRPVEAPPFLYSCWSAESTAEFDSMIVTITDRVCADKVSAEDVQDVVMVRLVEGGSIEILGDADLTIETGDTEHTVTGVIEVTELPQSATFALILPDSLPQPQVWDVDADFSFENNPNGVWSYHDVRDGALLLPTTQGIGSSPPGWSPDGTAATFPNLFTAEWSSAQAECEIGGAGPLEIRWTSPVAGTVGIRYTLHQLFEDLRELGVEIFHNDTAVEDSLLLAARHDTDKAKRTHPFFQVPESPGTRAHVVDAELMLDVAVGDTISYVQRAARDIEGDDETFGVSSFTIMEGAVPPPCFELCSNGVDDDDDGMIDCLDEDCLCNTIDDDSSNVKFPSLFDTNIELDTQGVTGAGHTTASPYDECPIPAEGFLPLSFANGCWAVDSTVEFATALVTITATIPTAEVSEADVNRTVILKIANGDSAILPIGSRTVGTSGGDYEVEIQSTVDSFSTLALVIPTEPVCETTEPDGEVSCEDAIDNDCDGLTDGDDEDCQCMATEPDAEVTCDDGIDNDCDELVDDADDDCQGVGPFLRGDCDGNGTVGGSPTEAIVLLGFAFRGDSPPDCLAACDAEANGSLGVTDALRILRHSFLGIGEPDPPFPECVKSTAKTDATLGCDVPFCSK